MQTNNRSTEENSVRSIADILPEVLRQYELDESLADVLLESHLFLSSALKPSAELSSVPSPLPY